MRTVCFALAVLAVAAPVPSRAWWDEGHMQIAAVAYDQLMPAVRAKVDALIRLNPAYPTWIASYPPEKTARYAFIRAATWADDIKGPELSYTDDGKKPSGPTAGQNVGYYDTLMHAYWHFKDIPFSTDGTATDPPDPVNAVTQIMAFTAGLSPSSGLPDEVRSYDLVWLLHLVGDAHQPLHATSRFSHDHPQGDRGGNDVKVVPATGQSIALHGYWDGLLGSYSTPQGAVLDAMTFSDTRLPQADPVLATETNPDDWFRESEKLAEDVAYAGPLHNCTQTCTLDREYETNARTTARAQAALAAARLANLINTALQ